MNKMALSLDYGDGPSVCAWCYEKILEKSEYKNLFIASTKTKVVKFNNICPCCLDNFGSNHAINAAKRLVKFMKRSV